ncbi:MAG: hypothetical protein KAY50_08895 [Chitinophagaceae bacterium]|nr:hypothetical protein [Chitinophagaceae bacterium]
MEKRHFSNSDFPLQEETDLIIRIAIDIHKNLGPGFIEIVYKDAFEYEFKTDEIFY